MNSTLLDITYWIHCIMLGLNVITGEGRKTNMTVTFSPISVKSPPGSILRSGSSAHASRTLSYLPWSMVVPNNTFVLRVWFLIQASWGTNAIVPYTHRVKGVGLNIQHLGLRMSLGK